MPHTGIQVSFKLDNAADVLTDISGFLDSVEGSSDTDQIDGTTFQPGVAVPLKILLPGFSTKGLDLTGKWSAAAETFFSAIENKSNLDYEYGPIGTSVGSTKITGKCTCSSWTGPQASVDGVITFSVSLLVATRVVGTF